MAKNTDKNNTENGLELDRMNLSNIVSNTAQKPMPATDEKPPLPPENKFRIRKTTFLTLITSLTVLVLILVFFFFFRQQDLSLNLMSGKTDGTLENYLRVGPISATLTNDDIINLTVDIECKNGNIKKHLTSKDSQIRDKIVEILTAPDMIELLRKQRYNEIKSRIKESLADVSSDPIGDVYISELLLY